MPDDLIANAIAASRQAISEPGQALATLAVALAMVLVVVSSFVRTMIPLRWLAVGSSVGFLIYGALHPAIPTLLLNAVLLPINIYRALEMIRLTRRVAAMSGENKLSGVWLRPYMHSAKVKAGTILFRQGDRAERLYLLADGEVEFVEIGTTLGPGIIFGEIAFFAPERRRRLTARCLHDCTVLSIDESTVKQLYYQNPAFGFHLIALLAGRLSADVGRGEAGKAAALNEPSAPH
jgi:CRP/FNR family transcriptional regulator, cyclic AMP receptor protein